MLLKFWFAPAVTAAVFAVIQLVGFGFYAGHVGDFTADGGFVDVAGYVGYAALLVVLWKNRGVLEKRSFRMFVFFAVSAVLREAGIQHWIASRDTTAFKIRFFLNPYNPLHEKNSGVRFTGGGGRIVRLRHDFVADSRFQRVFRKICGVVDGDCFAVGGRAVQNRGQTARQLG